VVVTERLMLGEDAVKELVVGRVAAGGVLEERVGDAAGGAEPAEQVLAAVEQPLEERQAPAQPAVTSRANASRASANVFRSASLWAIESVHSSSTPGVMKTPWFMW
jgi:hypothetical protein